MKRLIITALVFAACGFGIWQAVRVGSARTLARRASRINDIAAADRAVQRLPNDAETHAARGIVLQRYGNYGEACRELERAIQLRPHDYFLWMVLGVTRDLNEDYAGALQALQQSALLAPTYAKPRWQLANLLLRLGRTAEAFKEMRLACASDESLLPKAIDLAWGIYRNDVTQTVSAVDPQTDFARLKLATFFARHRHGAATLEQFHLVKARSEQSTHDLIQDLVGARQFAEAYQLWSGMHGSPTGGSVLVNPGFETDVVIGRRGFDWEIADNVADMQMSLDDAQHQSGTRSLRVDFRGNADAATRLLSQLVMVKPNSRYRLTFQALTKDFVSIVLPVVAVLDASAEEEKLLAESPPISQATEWKPFTVEFTTGPATQAVRVVVLRQPCAPGACPAYGTLWLDSFMLESSPR